MFVVLVFLLGLVAWIIVISSDKQFQVTSKALSRRSLRVPAPSPIRDEPKNDEPKNLAKLEEFV
jgi:hypothetical protein